MAEWRVATLVESKPVASDVQSLVFKVEGWQRHKSGQHYDIRLTAPDGYQAERKYSAASEPEREGVVEFGVQLLPDGEVSPYLCQMVLGEQVEIHGPLGGHFIWDVTMPGPLVLIGGGSGMVPLMSMLRHHLRHPDDERQIIFLISARSADRILYLPELTTIHEKHSNIRIVSTLTNTAPPGWTGYTRRIDQPMIEEVLGSIKSAMPMVYVCGPTPFVEAVADNLVKTGFSDHAIKTERFGGTGKPTGIA